MANKLDAYRGCLLGLAVGDAMGMPVDDMTWENIQESYGPHGLLGYDLRSDFAEITSYTQVAAYICNALLLSISRGKGDQYLDFVKLGLKEWTRSQQFARDPEGSYCWVAKLPAFRRRYCRDARMLDTLRLAAMGFPEKGPNKYNTPGSLTTSIAVGMFYNPQRLTPPQSGELIPPLSFPPLCLPMPSPAFSWNRICLWMNNSPPLSPPCGGSSWANTARWILLPPP